MSAGQTEAAGKGNPALRFFGLHSAEKATETVTWVAPYVGIFLFVLVLMSLLIQRFFPLPLWVHVLAVCIAGVNCFFFLARIRQSSLECEDAGQDGGGNREDPEEG